MEEGLFIQPLQFSVKFNVHWTTAGLCLCHYIFLFVCLFYSIISLASTVGFSHLFPKVLSQKIINPLKSNNYVSIACLSELYQGLIKLCSQCKLSRTFNKRDSIEVRKCTPHCQWESKAPMLNQMKCHVQLNIPIAQQEFYEMLPKAYWEAFTVQNMFFHHWNRLHQNERFPNAFLPS